MTPEGARWDKRQADLEASFLQSAIWGDFQNSIGHQPHYLSGDNWSCLLIERRSALGKYLFAPYGPTMKNPGLDAFKEIINFAKTRKVDWVRLEPIIKSGSASDWQHIIRQAGGQRSPRQVEPHLTRIVDLTRPSEDILASLSQTTRNIIRRNIKHKNLTFKTSREPKDIPLFTAMLDTVASRKGVGFYSSDYYKKQAEVLMPAGMMVLEVAFDGKKPVGTAIIHDYHRTSSYTYAASEPAARDKNVSALLLWQAMLDAKERGNSKIDLYGIAPDNSGSGHPWYGFSSFKKKFGGEVIEYAGTWDIPLSSRYRLYRSALRAKKLFRR